MVGWSSGTDHDNSRQQEHGCRGRHYALSSVQHFKIYLFFQIKLLILR